MERDTGGRSLHSFWAVQRTPHESKRIVMLRGRDLDWELGSRRDRQTGEDTEENTGEMMGSRIIISSPHSLCQGVYVSYKVQAAWRKEDAVMTNALQPVKGSMRTESCSASILNTTVSAFEKFIRLACSCQEYKLPCVNTLSVT